MMRRLNDQQLQEQVTRVMTELPENDILYLTAPDLAGTIVSKLRDQSIMAGYDRTVDIVFHLQQARLEGEN